MSRPGVNLAITADGETYNKLRRPDDFVASLAKPSPSEPAPAKPSVGESSKRKHDEAEISDSGSDKEPESKRAREEHIRKPVAAEKTLVPDPRRISRPIRECGMQSMFPGLDDDDSADDSTQDALAYLRGVRSEASTIPRFMVAEPEIDEDEEDRTMYDDPQCDFRATYNDGTWIAVGLDDAGNSEESDAAEDVGIQDAYYKALLNRYNNLRETLANADRNELAALVKADPDKYTNVRLPHKKKRWLEIFETTYPTPTLAAQMWDNNLYNALEFCIESLDRYDTISKQKSCWIWTLLALAGDRGTLDYYRIGRLRELALKAGQLGARLRRGIVIDHTESEDEVEQWIPEGEGVDDEDAQDGAQEETSAPGDLKPEVSAGTPAEDAEVGTVPTNEETSLDISLDTNEKRSAGLKREGISERDFAITPQTTTQDAGDESSDEGEILEDEDISPKPSAEAKDVEAARARLLAQLGERLVKPSVPPPAPGYRKHGGPRPVSKHHEEQVKNTRAERSDTPLPTKVLSRAEAEKQRQKVREEEPEPSGKKVFPSRAEAEKQRQKLREEELTRKQQQQNKQNSRLRPATVTRREQVSSEDTNPATKAKLEQTRSENNPQEMDLDSNSDSDAEMWNAAPVVDLNTRVTIDVLLTVVAECYGQRDLLRYREVW